MILVRHGQSEFNVVYSVTRVDPGIRDPRLTEEGRRQAAGLAEELAGHGVRRILASPYTRALETAAIIAERLSVPIAIDPVVGERAAFRRRHRRAADQISGDGDGIGRHDWSINPAAVR